jgi:ABC-type glutathione transport system ATPase component
VLDLLERLQRERSLAIVLVSHDPELVRGRCDRVLVLEQGRLVGESSRESSTATGSNRSS